MIVQKVKEGKADFGYNARTDKFENLLSVAHLKECVQYTPSSPNIKRMVI